jgi:hypothetical protein
VSDWWSRDSRTTCVSSVIYAITISTYKDKWYEGEVEAHKYQISFPSKTAEQCGRDHDDNEVLKVMAQSVTFVSNKGTGYVNSMVSINLAPMVPLIHVSAVLGGWKSMSKASPE